MRFFKARASSSKSTSLAEQRRGPRDGTELLGRVQATIAQLVAGFREVGDTYGCDDDAEVAIDRLFAYTLLILGAGEKDWRSFAQFTINESIPRRDNHNRALHDIQDEAEPWLRQLQARANTWVEKSIGGYVATLPDEWFRFVLPTGEATRSVEVKDNCVHSLGFGAVALTSFNFATDSLLGLLYVPANPIASLERVFALAE